MMVSSSITSSETKPTDDGRTNTTTPPTHLISLPDKMLASSDDQPGENGRPNAPPSPPSHLMSIPDEMFASDCQLREDGMPSAPPSSPLHLMSLSDEMLESSNNESSEDRMPNDISPPSHLMSFPDEVLVLIFSFLPLQDICNNAVRVCSRWLHIGRDYAVYRTITLTDDMMPSDNCNIWQSRVFSIIQKVVKLTSFKCEAHYRASLHVLLREVAKNCPDLQHLSVPNVALSSQVMEMFIEKCPHLCSINICWHSPVKGIPLSKFKHLRVLKLKLTLKWMTVNENEWFRNIVKECLSLEELYVGDGFIFDDLTLRCIVGQTKDRLKSLAFNTFNNATDCITELSSCSLLERLSLVTKTQNFDVIIDLSPLKPLRNLKCLKLKGFHSIVSKDNLRKLLAECTFKELRVLTILDCPFGDDELLQQMATSFPRLSIIRLHGFLTASDAGLAELIKKCPLLRSIRLERLGTLTKGTCFNIHHPSLETVEIVHCEGMKASSVDAFRDNSKLRFRFIEYLGHH